MNLATQVLQGAFRFKVFSFLCFAVICGALLLSGPAAMADQCSGALNSGSLGLATGCGAVITVTAVDGSGNATAFTVTQTGNGNPYDGNEDTLVGVQNNSGAVLNSITLTTAGSPPAFAFDGDGPCQFSGGSTNDCNGSTGYEGHNTSFSNISSDKTTGTVNFTNGGVPAANTCGEFPGCNTAWFALEGTPQSLSGGQTVFEPLQPGQTPFDFSAGTGAPTIQTIDYTNSGTNPTGTTMKVTFEPISQTQFNNLVAGTFAQGSSCMQQQISPNTFSCAVTIALCSTTPSDPTSFAGKNCPQSGPAASTIIGVIMKYFTNTFVDPTTVPAPGYLAATDNALNCGTDSDNSCRMLHNIFTGIANDCCTTSGGTKSFNSLFVPVDNLQTWYQPAGTQCDGDAGHQILQPVNADGTSVWKAGRTIPLKFRVCNASGVSVGTASVITNFKLLTITQGTIVSTVDETIDATTVDNGFRFDTTAQQWIFNLSTKGFPAPATFSYEIDLNDGTSIFFQFGLR